jgi:class 3 adenylate cyclase
MPFDEITQATECRLIAAVADIAGFMRAARGKSNLDTFRMLDEFYHLVEEVVPEAGGKVVKYIGDAALIVFPEDAARQAVGALRKLREEAQRLWTEFDATCEVRTKAHVGEAACGPLGPAQRFDVIGHFLNELFLMHSKEPEALSEELRRLIA